MDLTKKNSGEVEMHRGGLTVKKLYAYFYEPDHALPYIRDNVVYSEELEKFYISLGDIPPGSPPPGENGMWREVEWFPNFKGNWKHSNIYDCGDTVAFRGPGHEKGAFFKMNAYGGLGSIPLSPTGRLETTIKEETMKAVKEMNELKSPQMNIDCGLLIPDIPFMQPLPTGRRHTLPPYRNGSAERAELE